jgi:hypothetical protein
VPESEPHAFVVVITGLLSDNPETAKADAETIKNLLAARMEDLQAGTSGMQLTGLLLRMETLSTYKFMGLPNAG